MSSTARAFWSIAPEQGEIRDEQLREPGEGEVLVETRWSAVSRGSESLVFRGRVPPSEFERMRAPFQSGDFPFPVKYGYMAVGTVLAGPSRLLGRNVFCLHPHQTRFVVPADAAHAVPDDVPPQRAVLAANLETALNVVWDAGIGPGERVGVVGGGVVGCLVSWLAARTPGTETTLIDIDPARADVARGLGCRFATPAEAPRGLDAVIHASGNPAGLATAIAAAGYEATIVEASWYGAGDVPVPLGGAFHSQRLTLRSSQVGAVSPGRRPRWSAIRRLELAISLLADPALDCLISSESDFDELPETMARLAASPDGVLFHRVRYAGSPT